MKRIALGFILFILMPLCLQAGTTGKLAGSVVDARTGEPLVGANVILEGTRLGASTDTDGDFYIINIPVGTYTVTVSYVGYKTVKHVGVRVILDETTKLNFQLSEDIAEGETIIVTADQFKVQKDETTKKITIQSEEIQSMPVQDFSDMVAAQAGMVQIEAVNMELAIPGFQDRGIEEIHVRGGRSGEIGYTIDGLYITNPFYGHRYSYAELNDFAIEQVDIKTGVFDAEYGGAMSSMINLITRDGGKQLEGNLRISASNPGRLLNPVSFYSRDEDAPLDMAPEQDVLRDYREISGGIGGPVPFTDKNVRFIVTGHKKRRAYNIYEFDDLTYDSSIPADSGMNLYLNPLDTLAGWRALGFIDSWDAYSKFSFNISNTMKMDVSLWNLEATFRTANSGKRAYQYHQEGLNIANQKFDRQAIMFNHQLSKKIFYDIRLSRFYQRMHIGVTNDGTEDGRYLEPDEYVEPQISDRYTENIFWREYYVRGHDRYFHENFAETYEGFFNLIAQVTKHHQLKMGGSYRHHTIMLDEIQLPWLVTPYVENFKKNPEEASLYLQDLIEYDYMTIHLGLRMDMLNANASYWRDPYAEPDERELVTTDWEYTLSPRIGFSHVITDNATFTFGYGKFTQTPTYRNKYLNDEKNLKTPSPLVGNAGLNMEEMTAYEFGLNVGIGEGIITQIIGWSKEYSKLTSTERIPQFPYSYTTLLNSDYATARGVDFVLRRRSRNSQLMLQYTLSRATANRKDPWEGYRSTHTPRTMPKREILMSYDRTHDLSISYNYAYPKHAGFSFFGAHPLQRTSFNLMFMALSGWPYTPVIGNVAGETNSERGPWNKNLNLFIRKYVQIAGFDVIFGARMQNVFDWKNPIFVWPATGEVDDPGAYYNERIEAGIFSKSFFDIPYYYGRRRLMDFSVEVAF